MSSRYFKSNRKMSVKGLLSSEQLKRIIIDFPKAKIVKNSWNSFRVVLEVQPTSVSKKYQLLIYYEKNRWIEVFVIDIKLEVAANRSKLPHVYNSEKQQLCLYSPRKKEWNGFNCIVDTIIPWASEWLYFYELWLPEGKWYGGGHNEYPNEDNTKLLRDEQ